MSVRYGRSTESSNEKIRRSKDAFDRFFRDDLYGKWNSRDNIILSRGTWNDTYVAYPNFYKFCIDKSLREHWCGYSDSLGHERVFQSLRKLYPDMPQDSGVAVTMGNVHGLTTFFSFLKSILPKDSEVLSFSPYYPPILANVASQFPVVLIETLTVNETLLLEEVRNSVVGNPKIGTILIPNLVGVDGRRYSSSFFDAIVTICEQFGKYLIIDDMLWSENARYSEKIYSKWVIRFVTPSKMLGIAGMKFGHMIASQDILRGLYTTASNQYGGPPSLTFLLQEFLYAFESVRNGKGDVSDLSEISDHYGCGGETEGLFRNYMDVCERNQNNFQSNRDIAVNWSKSQNDFIEEVVFYDTINVIIKPKKLKPTYEFFSWMIQEHGVSIFPGLCIGFMEDDAFRINFLEPTETLRKGLTLLGEGLKKFYSHK